jgi:phage terminase large subunit
LAKKIQKIEGFTYTTGIQKMQKLKKRIKVIPGGTSAGKTYGILPILIDKALLSPLTEISVVSESVPHLRKGALKDFLKIMKATGRYIDKHYNKTMLTYTFHNGSYMEFFSADQEEKVRGPRRNILYINECNNIQFDTYHQLAIRTDREIWLDFNPSNEFWAYTELTADEDCEWCTLTYKDNEALAESIVKEIEKARDKAETSDYWANWWKVYGLGLLGSLQGVVLSNWELCDQIPVDAKFIAYGLDFGFTNDETGLVEVYKHNGELWINELIYETGLTNADISAKMISAGIIKNRSIVADSAEPKSIEELSRLGWYIEPSMKGKDSITNGLDILQRYKMHVTKRSTNLIKELRSYCWDKNRSGETLNKPIDAYNHLIDPLRYVALNKLKIANVGKAKTSLPYTGNQRIKTDFDWVK